MFCVAVSTSPFAMSQREPLPPCCHALSPGRKCSSKVRHLPIQQHLNSSS
jgi:hypothetical protein